MKTRSWIVRMTALLLLALPVTACKRKVVIESSLVPTGTARQTAPPASSVSSVAAVSPESPAFPMSADSAAVVQVAEGLLRALSARDTVAARSFIVPGMTLVSMRDDRGTAGVARVQTDADFARSLAEGTERLLERMWSPVVQIYGGVATVAAPYDFHVDGKWSHCGTDVFTLLRTGTGWRITGLSYTVQTRDCPAAPGLPND